MTRFIFANTPPTHSSKYCPNNEIKTSKYKWWNFLFLNLFEQFRRVANLFFLAMAILQMFPEFNVSRPPWLPIVPLSVIIAFTALKDAYEDYQRHQSDARLNNQPSHVKKGYRNVNFPEPKTQLLPQDEWVHVPRKDLRVGDFVYLTGGEAVPADIVLLATDGTDEKAYVSTMNLDGEGNLKPKIPVPITQDLNSFRCTHLELALETIAPIADLYLFTGTLTLVDKTVPLSYENLLLAGSTLENTTWAVGIVVASGMETKMALNFEHGTSKMSSVEKKLNVLIGLNFLLLLVMCLITTFMPEQHFKSWDAIYCYHRCGKSRLFNVFIQDLVVLQNLIPISLYVTVELVKTCLVFFIHQDHDMYDPNRDRRCVPKSWNLTEDLGRVEYLFSDKTGTLTENKMTLLRCCIDGKPYGESITDNQAIKHKMSNDQRRDIMKDRLTQFYKLSRSVYNNPYQSRPVHFFDKRLYDNMESLERFFTFLNLCHTVPNPTQDPVEKLLYMSPSPDEEALLQGSKNCGFVFISKQRDTIILNNLGRLVKFQLLHTLEFTSDRKRMSVIVRDEQGHIILIAKGADAAILPRLAPGQDKLKHDTEQQLSLFAQEGLRTLCIGYRYLEERHFVEWKAKVEAASLMLDGRDEHVEQCNQIIERELQLLGATAVEDKLQSGVPQTITQLGRAGIKIWMLTGDKLETAVSIAQTCTLFKPDTKILVLRDYTSHTRLSRDMKEHLKLAEQRIRMGLVVDGQTLKLLTENNMMEQFLLLCLQSESVVCCRLSALQKALIVQSIRTKTKAICVAVGDGANDVSMIQKSHVGVGVAGKEGSQAALASDFVISRFRHLSKLLLVHGHWAFYRLSELIMNFLYKSIVWCLGLFLYQILSDFQVVLFYDYYYIAFFNAILTLLPPLAIGIFDRDVEASLLLKFPEIYREGVTNQYLTIKRFFFFCLEGAYQAGVTFAVMGLMYHEKISSHGHGDDQAIMGTSVAMTLVMLVNIIMTMKQSHMTNLAFLVGIFSVFLGPISTLIFAHIFDAVMYGVDYVLFTDFRIYIALPLVFLLSALPMFVQKAYHIIGYPRDRDILNFSVPNAISMTKLYPSVSLAEGIDHTQPMD
ncbi:hypothetical protein EDD86DRAFT_269453 [Gorgonomyces haynaldii]|nr:hypothetical protein EDD86DRAFT_269453 [Gorgonomyces haynaldii]